MMLDDQILAVVQAHKEGKRIQCKDEHWKEWEDISPRDGIPWNFQLFTYRIVPEPPTPREWTVFVTPDKQIISWNNGTVDTYRLIRVREVIE